MFDKLVQLAKQLYPTGLAFKMPFGGEFEDFTKALALSSERFYNDSRSILFAILPDNNNFTVADAQDWERRLGLPDGSASTLSDRKAAIARKLNAPGINPAKGHYLNLERELRLAGFNVYVHENTTGTSPLAATGNSYLTPVQYGNPQYGSNLQYGSVHNNLIANRINESEDLFFNLAGTYKRTFFIGGQVVAGLITPANVPVSRKAEFRELILKLKRAHTVGFLIINYI